MSNIERVENIKQIVKMVQPQFEELAKIHNAVNYKKEASFALQILDSNEYLLGIALANQDSLKRAIVNVAAMGLTLNPLLKLAYLIPRKKEVILDPSYLGLLHLAQEAGAIKWALAEIVREKDEYQYQGMGREPIHKFNPFGDRGEIIGAYCLAKTHDDEFILTQMNNDEILSIRERSESYKSGKSSPWKTDTNEMIKKTLIRRASKSWPKTSTKDTRFAQAIDVTNELDFNPSTQIPPAEDNKRTHQIDLIRAHLKTLGRTEERYITYLNDVTRREIKKLEDLTDIEFNQAIIMLDDLVAKKAKEKMNENAG